MKKEQNLSPIESLAIIEQTIRKTKDNLRQYSTFYIAWGWMLAIAGIVAFCLDKFTDYAYFSAPIHVVILFGVAAIVIFYFRRRNKQKNTVVTYLHHFVIRLWYAIAISCIPCLIICRLKGIEPFAFMLILLGVGTLASGMSMRFRPLIYGGYFFLVSSVTCLLVPEEYAVLVFGLSVIGGYIIPGYLLKTSKQV